MSNEVNVESVKRERSYDDAEDAQSEPPLKVAKVDDSVAEQQEPSSTFDCGTPEGCPNHEKGEEKKVDTAASSVDSSKEDDTGADIRSQDGGNNPENPGNRDAENAPENVDPAGQQLIKSETEDSLGIVLDRKGDTPAKDDEEEAKSSPDVHPQPSAVEGSHTTDTKTEPIAPEVPGGLPSGVPGFTGHGSYDSPAQASAGVDPNVHATLANPDALVEEREEISPLYVGKVIGKGGEMIRDLQARSGCGIDVDQSVPPGQPRVITYKGTRKAVDFAKSLVRMLSHEGVSEADLPLGEAKREFLIIPSQSVGKVIGRGGEMIRELQSRSSAKIQVDHSGVSGVPSDKKQVTITGKEIAVVKAKEMVMFLVANPAVDALQSLNLLVEEKLRGGAPWGSGPPYPNLPNQGYDMRPEMLPPPGGAFVAPGFQQPQMGYVPAPTGMPYQPAQPAFQPQAYGQYPSSGQSEVDVIFAPKQFMGRIIGQRGVTVNDLQRRSGCDIQINQNVVQGQDCEITIRGNRQGIETAKQMIREIIEIGPAHPYAGGAEARPGGFYGGGGGGYQQQQGYDYSAQAYGGYQQGFAQPQAYGYDQQAYAYAQPPAMPLPPQPPAPPVSAWKAAAAPDGQVYYYNEQTGETQWEKPPGFM